MINKKAFTLLELFVAVVIIGLLLAILFPALGKVREGVWRVQCVNNLRQHGIAWYLYLGDHGENFPKFGTNPSLGEAVDISFGGNKSSRLPGDGPQYRVLNRYLDIYEESSTNLALFRCPGDKNRSSPGNSYYDFFGTSYVCNTKIITFLSPSGDLAPRPLSTVTSPRNKVYLEIDYPWNNLCHCAGAEAYTARNTPVMVLFVDGHVAGPFLYERDFAQYSDNQRPAIQDPNGTSDQWD